MTRFLRTRVALATGESPPLSYQLCRVRTRIRKLTADTPVGLVDLRQFALGEHARSGVKRLALRTFKREGSAVFEGNLG